MLVGSRGSDYKLKLIPVRFK